MMQDNYLTSHKKINFKWISDLNLQLDAVDSLKENTGDILQDIDVGKDYS